MRAPFKTDISNKIQSNMKASASVSVYLGSVKESLQEGKNFTTLFQKITKVIEFFYQH
jgi:hypothetical protein